jgi:hypothetical protein
MLLRKFVGFFDDFQIVCGTVLPHEAHQVTELGDGEGSRRDLFAQRHHADLPARLQVGTGRGACCDYIVRRRAWFFGFLRGLRGSSLHSLR